MDFGPVPLALAEGAILAHSLALPGGGRLRKGLVLGPAHLAMLAAAGVGMVTVARPAPGDVTEDAAAATLAAALVPDPAAAHLALTVAATGRVNFKAARAGVLAVDAARVDALNRTDPAITLATLPPLARVAPGDLVATVKIIPYAVPGAALAAACAGMAGAFAVRPVLLPDAGLVVTEVAGQKPGLTAKGIRAVEARLTALGMALAGAEVVAHDAGAIAAALGRMPGAMGLILTGSATSDLHDTAPEGLRQAGGAVERFGMPVDPGNLLFIGSLGGTPGPRPVIGLPGCVRSPALNGADWVLERLACGIPVTGGDIAGMGVGGLLAEIPQRPHPREG
ncbi:molybdopterin-binding protein [Ruixingdingia sedimenti]|uniref:Molybdopterin-binding protein n=1 Tax=Ruixingdingia sedimenti TaxID=3073604 RepID=A0ABU1F5M2_9RHOB|nr:molybdopterin-binding protein [Xinfangfangia sp. LG-4]MDR5651913.1 molybdopterin-binding protein [Xinfangfangia sp. LG-4]